MTDFSSEFMGGGIPGQGRPNWIRLRTIVIVRWIAIFGQIAALCVAYWVFRLNLEYGLCTLAIGVSVTGNLVAMFVFPESKLLSERENALMLLFDLIQLSFLLFLTGGLHNPFSILIVAPVTISATVLSLRSTLALGAVAILLASILLEFHFPLRTEMGFTLRTPDIFLWGSWIAIVIAIVFLSVYSRRVIIEMNNMSAALTATQMALAREQKLTDLGGVVAAAAHELGTPLATIKLTSSELMEELDDQPELREDAALIREQADRCRDILRSMGQAGKDDLHLRRAPLPTVIEDSAEPHLMRGKAIHFDHGAGRSSDKRAPEVLRRPEMIHGLRNLIQNAVDFCDENVWIDSYWTKDVIVVRITDDGPGYPPHLIGRIGDPFVRSRRSEKDRQKRPGYEGMGLGLFIAKPLLERSGAELSFANASDEYGPSQPSGTRRGAIIEATWPRHIAEMPTEGALGANPRFEP